MMLPPLVKKVLPPVKVVLYVVVILICIYVALVWPIAKTQKVIDLSMTNGRVPASS